MLGYLNLLLYPPLTASGAPFHSAAPLPGCPAGTNDSPPLKDLKRPKASATYLTHHPARRTPIPAGARVSGRAAGRGVLSLLSLLVPASHWTYNSGTKPGSHYPPNLVSKETSTGDPGTPAPNLERGWHLGIFWPICPFLSPPLSPCTAPSPYSSFPYFSPFNLFASLSPSCCPSLSSPPLLPPPLFFPLLVIKDKRSHHFVTFFLFIELYIVFPFSFLFLFFKD